MTDLRNIARESSVFGFLPEEDLHNIATASSAIGLVSEDDLRRLL